MNPREVNLRVPHDHFCRECGALFACPNLHDCPFAVDPVIMRAESVFALRAPRTPMHALIAAMNGIAREILALYPESPYATAA